MRTYCLAFRKHIENVGSRNITMKNKIIRNASRFMKQKHRKEVVSNIIKQTS